MQVYTKCSNYATDTCPCILAETGNCIECSMCRGEEYCSCTDTVSFCVMQELINNGGKARQSHQSITGEVVYVKAFDDDIRFVRIRVPDVEKYKKLGAYVFIRQDENQFFDVPISVLYEDYEIDSIALVIKIVGIKTEKFRFLETGDRVYVRGPYYNGILGMKSVALLRDSRAVMICRGIGFIPSLHILGALQENNNSVEVYVDEGQFSGHALSLFQDLQEVSVKKIKICERDGELSEDFCRIIGEAVSEGVGLIHLGFSDYLLKKAIGIIEETDPNGATAISCINNTHICCGEGICGACIKPLDAGHIVRLCKEQLNPREYRKVLL